MTRSRWQDMTPTKLRKARMSLGLTQEALGAALGFSPCPGGGTVRRWERSERGIPGTVKILVWLILEFPEVRALLVKTPAKPSKPRLSADEARAARKARLDELRKRQNASV